MTIRLLQGHVLEVLAGMEAASIHTVCTSPPYLWLRAYGTEPQAWPDGWVGELGQEETPELYVQHLVAVMGAVGRVLREDGTLWVNLAGCYFNDPGGQNGGQPALGAGSVLHAKQHDSMRISAKAMEANKQQGRQKRGRHPWLKALDWVDVPGLFAHAMQAAGWLWRSDVVWVKPSALPESVSGTRWERCRTKVREGTAPGGFTLGRPDRQHTPTEAAAHFDHRKPEGSEWADCPGCPRCAATQGYVLRRGNGRPTKSTERVLLFIKKPGAYFDSEGVREALQESTLERSYAYRDPGAYVAPKEATSDPEQVRSHGNVHGKRYIPNGRNLRDWWVLSPEPLKSEHYAAYPTSLPTRCIKAGTSERGCCPGCGAPWARVIDRGELQGTRSTVPAGPPDRLAFGKAQDALVQGMHPSMRYEDITLGWRPTCRCPGAADLTPVPCRVLDPFAGSGTTLIAADRLGRDAVGVELKPQYVQMAQRRVSGDAPLLMWGAVTVEGDTPGSVPEAVPLLLEEP